MLSGLSLGPAVMAPSRTNGFLNMLESMRKRTVMLTQQLPRFPSLQITASTITPQGSFAEAQAQYLSPDAGHVDALVKVCGVVKHQPIFVMALFTMQLSCGPCMVRSLQSWPIKSFMVPKASVPCA